MRKFEERRVKKGKCKKNRIETIKFEKKTALK